MEWAGVWALPSGDGNMIPGGRSKICVLADDVVIFFGRMMIYLEIPMQ